MADGVWTFELCDQDDVLLADITGLVTATVSPRLNRPFSLVLEGPSDQDVWKTIHTDDERYDAAGVRTVKAKRNGVLICNAEIWLPSWTGDENNQRVQLSCFDSMIRTAMRRFADDHGRWMGWIFDDPISAGDLVQQAFALNVTHDDSSIPFGTTRRFPIDHNSGLFSASTDVSEELTDGPISLGDLVYTRISELGIADVVLEPTDTAAGSDPGIYGILNCVDAWGSDKTGTVHFDYDAGDRNVKSIRRSRDMSQVCNWQRYGFTPKTGNDRFRATMESVDPLLLAVTTHYRDIEAASRAKYGSLAEWSVFDTDSNSARALYRVLFETDVTLRVNPRELAHLTPAGAKADGSDNFEPFADYNIGDRVSINIGDNVGPAITNGVQRIYGFDLTIDKDGVESPGELIVSPDGASG